MTTGRLSRTLARVASVLWIPIAGIYTVFVVGYLAAMLDRSIQPPMAQAALQVLVYASIAIPGWFLVWALWTRPPSWRVAVASAVIGSLLFVLLAGTLFGILALGAGLLPLVSMAVQAER